MSVFENETVAEAPEINVNDYSQDELISMLQEQTETRNSGTVSDGDPNFESETTDFDPAPEPEPLGSDADLDDEPAKKLLLSAASVPVETLVETVDMLLTNLIISRTGIDQYDGDADGMITTDSEKRSLTKAANQYLASQELKVSPLSALLLTVGLIYGKKLMASMQIRRLMKRNEQLEMENEELRNSISNEGE